MIKIKIYHPTAQPITITVNEYFPVDTVTDLFDDNLDEGGTYSIPISVVATDELRNFLKFPESFASNQTLYFRCDVYNDDVQIMHDVNIEFEVADGELDLTYNNYSFTILGSRSRLGKKMLNKKLANFAIGGVINWIADAGDIPSREFAENVMRGNLPQYEHRFAFAPVKIFDYFDDSRGDYNDEILQNDIVNKILENNSYTDKWTFGADTLASPNVAVNHTVAEYAEYRTVPFLKLTYILQEIFKEMGYKLDGDFFTIPDVEDMYIYNNHSLERYNWPAYADTNRVIKPTDHVPDILLVDFYAAVKSFFCLKQNIVGNTIYLNKKVNTKLYNSTDITNSVLGTFSNGKKTDANKYGLRIGFDFGMEDGYSTDHVKALDNTKVIGTVALYADISALTITPVDGDLILVTAENYYYRYDANTTTWIPDFEALQDFVSGDNPQEKKLVLSPLCQLYTTSPSGLRTWQNMPATRQPGSYFSNGKINVTNPSGLRIFYIKKMAWNNSAAMPVAFTHNTDLANTKRAEMSLALMAHHGVYNTLHKVFIERMLKSWQLNIQFIADADKLPSADIIRIAHKLYFVKSYSTSLLDNITDAEIITID